MPARRSARIPAFGTPDVSANPLTSGVSATSLRATNLSLVLREVLAAGDAATRASVASRTGITPTTVSRLVDELLSKGILSELPPVAEATRGRPASRLTAAPGRTVALGMQVNVFGIDARLVDLAGTVLAEATVEEDLAGSDPREVMSTLARTARRVLDEGATSTSFLVGSGLALPGIVSPEVLTVAPNLGWRDLPLRSLLEPLGELAPRIVANEADLAAFAVSQPTPGVPSGPASFIYVSGEVGIGSGIVVDHVPLVGANGWAGELGHVCVDPHGPVCSCGASGCLEAFLGHRALIARAGLPQGATTRDLLAALAAEGESGPVHDAIDEAGAALGRALSTAINLVDIPLVLLGGAVGELAEAIAPATLAEIRVRTLQAPWIPPHIEAVPGSTWLSVTGAAHRILQGLAQDPLAWTGSISA
ncbi:ROK family protein [Schaalia sp. 19OD2882]|uniref:ROK family protein n=1 Tax=Schaalia sp. 19OD2882 TaxID=2794089 RepID=UPI001C1EBAEB|nr:ROK family protein [Schaalia sp. 19OD2882]QWW19652.1 ROK family protein [Schaalia sp. 19OD2882]